MTENVKPSSFPRAARFALVAVLFLADPAAALRAETDPGTPIQPLESVQRAAERGLREQVAATLPDLPGTALRIELGSIDPRLRLPRCAQPLEAGLPVGATLRHRTVVRVACAQPQPWAVQLPVLIETDADVLVLERALPRGAEPGPSDVRSVTRRLPGLVSAFVADPRELGGLRLRRPLEAGSPLAREALEAAPVVRRGQSVTLVSRAGGIEVKASGEALADAAPGQRVRIRNADSLKIVEGVADKVGYVRVGP